MTGTMHSSAGSGTGCASWRRCRSRPGAAPGWRGGCWRCFRLGEHVHALDGVDPLAGVAVLGRGLVGDAGGEPVVASALYKQRYALMDGRCLDDPALSVACWPVRLGGARSGYSWGEWHHLKTVFSITGLAR